MIQKKKYFKTLQNNKNNSKRKNYIKKCQH